MLLPVSWEKAMVSLMWTFVIETSGAACFQTFLFILVREFKTVIAV